MKKRRLRFTLTGEKGLPSLHHGDRFEHVPPLENSPVSLADDMGGRGQRRRLHGDPPKVLTLRNLTGEKKKKRKKSSRTGSNSGKALFRLSPKSTSRGSDFVSSLLEKSGWSDWHLGHKDRGIERPLSAMLIVTGAIGV